MTHKYSSFYEKGFKTVTKAIKGYKRMDNVTKSVVVVFDTNGTEYVYMIRPGDRPKTGDIVITSINELGVYSSSRYDSNLKAARVKELSTQLSNRYYLQLIPEENFEETRLLNKRLRERDQHLKEAKCRLKVITEEYTRKHLLKELVAVDHEARHLIAYINGETDEYEA